MILYFGIDCHVLDHSILEGGLDALPCYYHSGVREEDLVLCNAARAVGPVEDLGREIRRLADIPELASVTVFLHTLQHEVMHILLDIFDSRLEFCLGRRAHKRRRGRGNVL